MKKLHLIVVLLIFGLTSCMDDSVTSEENKLLELNSSIKEYSTVEQTAIVENYFSSFSGESLNKAEGFCHRFTVTVSVGFLSIETSVTVCCTTTTYSCVPLPNYIIKSSNRLNPYNLGGFEVIESSTVQLPNGKTIKIKSGIYNINDEGAFELEYLENR